MKQRLKRFVFGLLGKDPEAVVVTFWTGDDERCGAIVQEVRGLVPDRRHFVVAVGVAPAVPGVTVISLPDADSGELYLRLRDALRPYRIGLAPVLFGAAPHPLRAAAVALAPTKILAYNANLERHHLHFTTLIASCLFLRGVPLDRIFLRPWWLCPWKRDRTRTPDTVHIVDGRPLDPRRKKVAVLSPYFPFPLAHGGAVRIFHLLREAATEFDIFLFTFAPKPAEQEFGPVLEFCAQAVVVEQPYYREPRWSTLQPPEVAEFDSPAMRRALAEHRAGLLQIEYTQLASYAGDVLVEHDITWDLFRQVHERERTAASWWDLYRWRRFESKALRRFRHVVVMSEKDAGLAPGARVIENGVDFARFTPEPEAPGIRLLFVGSFNHFPNVQAYRFFVEAVWPLLRHRFSTMRATIVAGRDHLLYWRQFTGLRDVPSDRAIDVHGFVRDVRPLYVESNIVVVPTVVSAGTNLKVLEAMAMERAVVSTTCGCAGLGLEHGRSVWIADDAGQFAEGVAYLATHPEERSRLARNARVIAERNFDWKALGEKQRALWRSADQPG